MQKFIKNLKNKNLNKSIYITYVIDSAVFLITVFCTTLTVLLVNGRAAGAHFLKDI
jgi:hypothetical protein